MMKFNDRDGAKDFKIQNKKIVDTKEISEIIL